MLHLKTKNFKNLAFVHYSLQPLNRNPIKPTDENYS